MNAQSRYLDTIRLTEEKIIKQLLKPAKYYMTIKNFRLKMKVLLGEI